MRIIVADHAGFCYGVQRALRMAEEAAASGPIHSIGPLIHNPQVVARLEEKGVKSVDNLRDAAGATVIVRTHGVPPEVMDEAEQVCAAVVDATCPFVKRAHEEARELQRQGYTVVVVGERDHPEVVGIVGHTMGQAHVVEDAEEAARLPRMRRVGVVAQTTQRHSNLREVVDVLLQRCEELRVFSTICDATTKRQDAALSLAKQVDAMIVVGGRGSANTRRLAEICTSAGARTWHVETAADLRAEWFNAAETVGITAGASTPDFLVEEVVEWIRALGERQCAGGKRES